MVISRGFEPSGPLPQNLDTQKFHVLFNDDSGFSCLAKLAKAYRVSGATYLSGVPNELHCIPNYALEVPVTVYWARLMSLFTIKPFAFFIKD